MAQSDSSSKSVPTIRIRLRGCDDEASFLQHVLERFTTGGLRLKTKAEPALGSDVRVAYQLSDGRTVFHALCLVTQVGQVRDGRRALELKFKKMSRDSKRIYDRIIAARQILTRGIQEEPEQREPRITQVPPRNAPETQPLPDNELQARDSVPTPLSGVHAAPSAVEDTEADEDATPLDGEEQRQQSSGEAATSRATGSAAQTHEPAPSPRRERRRLTTEEVLQLEDDELMQVEHEPPPSPSLTPPKPEPVFGEFDLFGDEDIGLSDESILSESATADDSGDHEEIDDDLIVGEADIDEEPAAKDDAGDHEEIDDELIVGETDIDEEPAAKDDAGDHEEIDDELIVGEDEIDEEPATEDDSGDHDEIDDELIVGETDIDEEPEPTEEGIEENTIDDELIVGEADIDEESDEHSIEPADVTDVLGTDEDAEAEGLAGHEPTSPTTSEDEASVDMLDAELEGSFDDSFDDSFDAMFHDFSEEVTDQDGPPIPPAAEDDSIHRATTEETDVIYGQANGEQTADEDGSAGSNDAFDIVRDAFEFASSDVKSFSTERRDPSTLRLASASYQAVPDDEVDEAPEIVDEEPLETEPPPRESRPSDAYDIVRDAFEFASSESSEFETVNDPKRLKLASAAYQAITDEEIASHEEREKAERSSEDQEREALEALSSQKDRKGPRPIVGPAVRKKKGFFDRFFSNDD